VLETARPAQHLPQCFDIGRQPCQPVRGALFAVQRCGFDAAIDGEAPAQRRLGIGQEAFGRQRGLFAMSEQMGNEHGSGARGCDVKRA